MDSEGSAAETAPANAINYDSSGDNISDAVVLAEGSSTDNHDGGDTTDFSDEASQEKILSPLPPSDNPEDDAGYDSDDSCASHDSFVTNLDESRPNPSKGQRYHPPDRYVLFPDRVVKKPFYPAETKSVKDAAPCSRLENLPPELRENVLLNMPDLETLRSLVHASPIMHSQYLDNRHAILSTNKMIIDFCASYDKWLKGWSPYPSLKSLPPSRVRWMAAFHLSVARPQVRLFVSWALENLSAFHRDIIPSWENGHIKISRSEEARILRAIYRHEVYHHLFGQNLGFRDGYDFESEVINGLFVELFHPWEVEAIGCFQVFVQGQWRDLLKPFIRDLDAPWRTVTMQYERLAAMVSSGLKYLTRIQALSSSKDRIHVTGRCINPLKYYESNLDWALYKDAQRLRRIRRFVNEKDKAQSKGLDMEFHGDSLPAEGPPLPWVLAFGGRYANIYGNDFELREKELGWVMWDAKRWSDTGREFYDKRSIHLL